MVLKHEINLPSALSLYRQTLIQGGGGGGGGGL